MGSCAGTSTGGTSTGGTSAGGGKSSATGGNQIAAGSDQIAAGGEQIAAGRDQIATSCETRTLEHVGRMTKMDYRGNNPADSTGCSCHTGLREGSRRDCLPEVTQTQRLLGLRFHQDPQLVRQSCLLVHLSSRCCSDCVFSRSPTLLVPIFPGPNGLVLSSGPFAMPFAYLT